MKKGFFNALPGRKLRDHISRGMTVWLLACVIFHPLMHLESGHGGSETGHVRFCAAQGGETGAAIHEELLRCPLCSGIGDVVCFSGEESAVIAERIPEGKSLPDVPSHLNLPELPSPRGPPAA